MVNVFNVSAFFIVLREVLEACLVVGIVLAYLSKTGATHLKKWVWIGAGAGVGLSAAIGVAFAVVFYVRGDQIFTGKAEAIFEGITFIVAAGLLSWMILWMLFMGKSLRQNMEGQIDKAMEKKDGGAYGILFMVFLQVFREGIETIIFLFGAASSDDSWRGILLPGFLAIVIGIGASYAVFRGLVTLDINKFFLYSSVVLMAFAAGLVSHGLHELQEADWFGPFEDVDNPDRDWWNAKMWTTKDCCNDKENQFFAMLRALFGYQDTPTFVEWASYFGYWLIIGAIFVTFQWHAVKAARATAARYAKLLSSIALPTFLVGFIFACGNASWTSLLSTILGLLLSIAAVLATLQTVSELIKAIKPLRRVLALGASVGFAVYTLFVGILHIVQMSCLDRSCRFPSFFYFGLIFNASFNEQGVESDRYVTVAVLSVSLVVLVFFGIGLSFSLYLFSTHLTEDGDYPSEDVAKVSDEEVAIMDDEVHNSNQGIAAL